MAQAGRLAQTWHPSVMELDPSTGTRFCEFLHYAMHTRKYIGRYSELAKRAR
jgi:hypothetical protein